MLHNFMRWTPMIKLLISNLYIGLPVAHRGTHNVWWLASVYLFYDSRKPRLVQHLSYTVSECDEEYADKVEFMD